MHTNEALLYLPLRGIDPSLRVKCPLCSTPFVLAKGKAHAAQNNGEHFMAFVCSDECFLEKVPISCCYNA